MLDSWAWWEILHETRMGASIARRYLQAASAEVLTVDFALAEVAAKLARAGAPETIDAALATMEAASEIVPVTRHQAAEAATLLLRLREKDRDASLADAVMLAAAREHRAKLVSNDPAFKGQRDVVRA